MIGVFDSGEGGLCTVEKIKELSPSADICFLADRENAPYGTKTRSEIISLTKKNIKRLREEGAGKVLIACCTASSVYPYLTDAEKEISVPVIDATARLALEKSKTKRIGVIATRATAESGAFERAIKNIDKNAKVWTEEAQSLVFLIENGARDGNLKKREAEQIKTVISRINSYPFDILILGCTHFPRLERTISELSGRETVSSALAGAYEILKDTKADGSGRTIFL